jgi:hypothetical protein
LSLAEALLASEGAVFAVAVAGLLSAAIAKLPKVIRERALRLKSRVFTELSPSELKEGQSGM